MGEHGHSISEGASNFALSVVASVAPRDALEAMLAVQMAAVHQATMMMARRLNHVQTIPQQDATERALNKLARTYAAARSRAWRLEAWWALPRGDRGPAFPDS